MTSAEFGSFFLAFMLLEFVIWRIAKALERIANALEGQRVGHTQRVG